MSDEKLYMQIERYIREKISEGDFKPGQKLPTEQALAAMFGVSRITSRRALDNLRTAGVITRSQGRGSFAAGKNTAPAKAAESFRSAFVFDDKYAQKNRKVVAMVLPYDILQGRLIEIVQNATEVLAEKGYHLTLHNSGAEGENERRLFMHLIDEGVNGIILYPTTDTNNIDLLYDMWTHQIPLVAVDKKILDLPISCVYANNYQGAYELSEHMIKKGHRKIGCLFNVRLSEVYTARKRYFGFCSAMKQYGLGIDYNFVEQDFWRKSNGMNPEDTKALLANIILRCVNEGMTAMLVENDYMALDAIKACNTAGITVPGDLSVVGFDNLPQCEFAKPTLTTCEQDFGKMGALVGELLLAQMDKHDFTFVEHCVPTRLFVRDSVKEIADET